MPRFDNEGFDKNRVSRNDRRDRSVPDNENYYGGYNENYKSNDYSSAPVVDNQGNRYYDDYNQNDIQPPVRSERQNGYNENYRREDYENAYKNGYGNNNSGYNDPLRGFDLPQRSQRGQNNSPKHSGSRNKSRGGKGKKPNKSRVLNKPKKILLSIVAVLLVIIIAINSVINGILNKITYDEKIDNKYVTSSELKSDSSVKNILLLGVDARSDDDAKKSRADTMMLISVDSKHKTIKMTSFLRDTWVYIPAKGSSQRLNAACSYGGYNGVCDTIEYNFGIKIDGYVVADFSMFKILVDSIGGVTVNVTKKEANEINSHKKRYGNVKIKSGKHKLTGEQALAYCRIRKIDTDFMRTKRQRTVMRSIIKGIKKSGPITLMKMAKGAAPYIETDLTKGEIKRIAFRALMCLKNDMAESRVPFEGTWKYANIGGASVISIDKDANKEKLIDLIYNKTAEEIKAENKSDKK